jgi:hypothetical protein
MIGHRPSSLPIAKHCGQAPRYSAMAASGRPAVMGKAYHALMSAAPETRELMAQLTAEEKTEVLSWKRPATIVMEF